MAIATNRRFDVVIQRIIQSRSVESVEIYSLRLDAAWNEARELLKVSVRAWLFESGRSPSLVQLSVIYERARDFSTEDLRKFQTNRRVCLQKNFALEAREKQIFLSSEERSFNPKLPFLSFSLSLSLTLCTRFLFSLLLAANLCEYKKNKEGERKKFRARLVTTSCTAKLTKLGRLLQP